MRGLAATSKAATKAYGFSGRNPRPPKTAESGASSVVVVFRKYQEKTVAARVRVLTPNVKIPTSRERREKWGTQHPRVACYHCRMFNFGKPKTAGDWIVHIAGAMVAIFLVWWMLRLYVL